ncbi:MAG: hypothetical protein B5M51_00750 [Anaerolinea sp. 4484_236]|nr:MAG: hypothetical protein B5M51_00750 [Anaerolinea sp. 4484_236]
MTNDHSILPADYWQTLEINQRDIDFLHTHLFDIETPLTMKELVAALVVERIRSETEAILKKRKGKGKIYLPKGNYAVGDELIFPALGWQKGQVTALRSGENPEIESFDVLTVSMEDESERLFAGGLAEHALNEEKSDSVADEQTDPEEVLRSFGSELEDKLDTALRSGEELVQIAGRWFPRALLVDVNIGHLNLAEAVLDMVEGEPLNTSALMKDIDIPGGDNENLTEFSLNYALQEDPRFDEVGSTGQVLWCLERLEPEAVREVPAFLRYTPVALDRNSLTEDMLALEAKLDDELSKIEVETDQKLKKAVISLIYPHWRLGTLPISARVRSFFPTAYESPRIRFTLVDGKTGEKMPGWVVRDNQYVYGLRDWYEAQGLMPGSLIEIRRGKKPGEVIIEAQTHRGKRDWVRTVIVGVDGGIVFATLKQVVNAKFDDRMALAITDAESVDKAWKLTQESNQTFEQFVYKMMQELTKLNSQGHVHAQELYSAVNLLRRCPPAPLFGLLATQPWAEHVGDLHFRLVDAEQEEEEA